MPLGRGWRRDLMRLFHAYENASGPLSNSYARGEHIGGIDRVTFREDLPVRVAPTTFRPEW